MSIRRLMRRFVLGIAVSGIAGCSLLVNSSENGHPCGPAPAYACLPNYACNTAGFCVPAGQAQCEGGCGTGMECVRQQCVPICNGLSCAPGLTCATDGGGCVTVPPGSGAGESCFSDSDCLSGTSNNLFCLLPYTGGPSASGVCTTTCTKANRDAGLMDSCTGSGESCTTFPSDTDVDSVPGIPSGIDICAPAGLTPCPGVPETSPCGNSGLVCGVLYGNTSNGAASVTACVSPVTGGMATAGMGCSNAEDGGSAGVQCASGLCIIQGGTSPNHYCTVPCASSNDCTGPFTSTGQTSCTSVTIVEQDGIPKTRAKVCIEGLPTFGESCTQQNNPCGADAPVCASALFTSDAGPEDAGAPDAGPSDAGIRDGGTSDAGSSDAGSSDAGSSDAGDSDAGALGDGGTTDGGTDAGVDVDAGSIDAGVADAGPADSGPVDAGPTDAGPTDAGHVDAGPVDAGKPDAGFLCAPYCSNALVSCPTTPGGIPLMCDTSDPSALPVCR